jgi:N-formylglutamate amidohydrolase
LLAEPLIVRRADGNPELPVVVSIPHFGTDPLPGINVGYYRDPEYEAFPYGYTDPFAAQIYGDLHRCGATVVATPLSRLFVDVNRARDSFEVVAGTVNSNRGVIRTHIRGDEALFREPLTEEQAERRLQRHYDPFHEEVSGQIARLRQQFRQVVLLDAHTASAKHLGDHEVVIGTGRGRTCSPELSSGVFQVVREAGFECSLDVPGYSGGHLVRRHGATAGPMQAVQLEFNSGLVMRGSRQDYARACRDGGMPDHDAETLARCVACVNALVEWLGDWCHRE